MAGLRVEQYTVGPVMTNCYFAVNEETKEMFVVDPGDAAEALAAKNQRAGAYACRCAFDAWAF